MWRYQRPQFGALVLAELQRQQSCSQFCDTVLKADGVSVPAHSCILAALSPQLSCALSALPSPPSGQQHLLEFRTFRACSLLRLVGLLYSGEMVGEGEMERQEMVTAAARLGIQGLVEVGPRDEEEEDSAQQLSRKACQSSVEESQSRVVLQRDVGVQTDTPQCPGAQNMTEGGTRGRRQKRGREALTMRLRKRLNIAEIPRGTGDSELIGSNMAAAGAPNRSVSPEPTGSARLEAALTVIDRPAPLSVSHQTQASGVVVPGTLSMPLPYIPLSQLLYCPPGGNHSHNKPPPSVLIPCGESAAVYVLPPSMSSVSLSASGTGHVSEALPPFTSDPQHAWRAWPTAEGGLEQDGSGEAEGFERFEGNIAGFINHFLDPAQPQGESTRGRRGRRGRRSLAGGARRGGTERRARRPRRGVRARGGVEKHGSEIELAATEVSRRVRLWSGGIQDCRIGRGGGVVGRKLCLKPRELIQPIKICLKRRGQSQKWEITGVKERGGASRCSRKRGRGQRKRGPKLSPDGFPVIKRQRSPLQLLPFPALPLPLYQALTYDPPSPSTPPASPPALAHYTAPAPALLHTAPLPPLEPPPQEDSAEQFDRLLEDIMDLDFSCRGCQDAGRGVVIAAPSNVDAVTELTGRVDSSEVLLNHGAPTCGGELTDILDHFLRSFEHQVAALNQAAVNQTSACLLEPDPSTTSCNGAWPSASDSIPATPVRAELMKILPGVDDVLPSVNDTLPSINDALPGVDDALPGVDDALPGVDDALPGVDDALPGVDDALPGVDDALPGVDDALPGVDDALPGVDDALPGVDDALPGEDDALPGEDDALPGEDDALPGEDDALPGEDVVRLETKAESPTGKRLPLVNQPISSAEEMKAQTTTQPAGESVMKSQTLSPNSPMRSPEKLTSQSGQPFRTRVEGVSLVSEVVAVVRRGRGRPPKKGKRVGVCAEVTAPLVSLGQTGCPTEQTGQEEHWKRCRRRGQNNPQLVLGRESVVAMWSMRNSEPARKGKIKSELDRSRESTLEPDRSRESTLEPDRSTESTLEPARRESTLEPTRIIKSTLEPARMRKFKSEPDRSRESNLEPDRTRESTLEPTRRRKRRSEPARRRKKRRKVEESDKERETTESRKECPELGVFSVALTLLEAPPPISVPETPICEEQVAQKSGDDSGMEGMAEEEDLHVTQRANPLTCQDVSEALQTQSSRMESEGTPEEMEKPEEGEDLEDVGAVEEDSDRSVDVVGEDGEVWLKSDSAENPYTQSENRAMGKVPVQERSVNLAVARPSQSRRELEVEGSTGSREEEEEEVDVLGGFSPSDVLPVILPGSWGEGLNSDEEEEEIDVIGGQFDHTPFIGPWV